MPIHLKCIINKNGEDFMETCERKNNKQLEMKQETLKAWTKIMLNEGYIDINKYNKMIASISKLRS